MPVATTSPPFESILDRMAILGDPIRCRVLLLLERHELAVSELCSILQLPQSTVSRHLKVLATGDWVTVRKEGTSRLYSLRSHDSEAAQRLWELVRHEIGPSHAVEEDRRRLEGVLARRRSSSKAFFSSASNSWSEMRHEIFGQRFDLEALLALVDPSMMVGDLGTGTGHVARTLAPYVQRIVAIDDSPEMLEAASDRLSGLSNVELRAGRLEELPVADGSLDVALLILVLHHLPEPQRVFDESARVLKPGGRILVADMLPHDRDEYRRDMGHVWLGFEETQLADWLGRSGFVAHRFHAIRPEPQAVGPSLFTATAVLQTTDTKDTPADVEHRSTHHRLVTTELNK